LKLVLISSPALLIRFFTSIILCFFVYLSLFWTLTTWIDDNSEQATIQGFEAKGFSREESESLLKKSVEIATEARNSYYDKCGTSSSMDDKILKKRPILVAASVGSYGAYLADGSEYRLLLHFSLIYVDDMSLGWNKFLKLLPLALFRF